MELAKGSAIKIENVWQLKDLQTRFLDVWQGKDLQVQISDVWQAKDLTEIWVQSEEMVVFGGKRMGRTTSS